MSEHCHESLRELQTYLDGECGPSLEAAIRRHLEQCPPCLDRAEFEQELRRIVAAKCREAAPQGLVDRVLDAVRHHPTA